MQKQPSTLYQPYILPSKYPLQFTLADASSGNSPVSGISAQADLELISAQMHFHDCCELAICTHGNGILYTSKESFPFHSKDILLLCPYTPHRILHSPGCTLEYIHVNLLQIQDPNIFPDLRHFAEMLLQPCSLPCRFAFEENPDMYEYMHLCLEEAKERKPYYEMSIRGYFLCIVSKLYSIWKNMSDTVKHQTGCSLTPALIHMNLYYTQELMIPQLSKLCHLSDTHFRRLFKSYFQMSPLDYLNRIRIRESCTLLSGITIRISQASVQSGFRTLSSYNRKFQELYGMSPTEWLRDVMPKTEKIPRIIMI